MTDNEPLRAAELRIEELEADLDEAKAEIARQDTLLAELQDKLDNLSAAFTPNDGADEPPFRAAVRNALGLDWSVNDMQILAEIKK